jgi:hypothetical protein
MLAASDSLRSHPSSGIGLRWFKGGRFESACVRLRIFLEVRLIASYLLLIGFDGLVFVAARGSIL